MKKTLSAVLALALCLALAIPSAAAQTGRTYAAIATNNTIVVSNSTAAPDAHVVSPAVYKIEGYNYFKLRDAAMLLNGSDRQFAVDYDEGTGSVSITSGRPYAPIGGELTGAAAATADAMVSNNSIIIDGSPVTLTAFKIAGANYFRLRDLGKALDFRVGYDDAMKTVSISGARGYDYGSDPDFAAAKAVRVNWCEDERVYGSCLNSRVIAETRHLSSELHLPVFKFDDRQGLEAFMEEYSDLFAFDRGYNDIPSFSEAASAFGDGFFAGHSLLCVYMVSGSGSCRYGIRDVTTDGGALTVRVEQTVRPEAGTADMAGWFMFVDLEDSALDGVTAFDALYVG